MAESETKLPQGLADEVAAALGVPEDVKGVETVNADPQEFPPDARCHWRKKDAFFQGDTCTHRFAKHVDAGNHVDNLAIGHACMGGDDDDEDTWCCCTGFQPTEQPRFPDPEELERYQKAMRGE